jgi:cytochrome b561
VTRAVLRQWRFGLLAAACLLVGHNAVYLVELGPGERMAQELRHAGHAYWPIASLLLAAGAVLLALMVLRRLLHLTDTARGLPDVAGTGPHYAARFGQLWLRLMALVVAGFVLQENVEHLLTHHHMPGVAALIGPEHPLALAVLAGVSGLAAALGALVAGHEAELLARIAQARRLSAHAPRRLTLRPGDVGHRPRRNPLATAVAGRAPPAGALIHVAA